MMGTAIAILGGCLGLAVVAVLVLLIVVAEAGEEIRRLRSLLPDAGAP